MFANRLNQVKATVEASKPLEDDFSNNSLNTIKEADQDERKSEFDSSKKVKFRGRSNYEKHPANGEETVAKEKLKAKLRLAN